MTLPNGLQVTEDERQSAVIGLFQDGIDCPSISSILEVKLNTIQQIVARWGLSNGPTGRSGRRPIKTSQLRELLIAGHPLPAAAAAVGAHISLARTVYRQLVAEGLRGPPWAFDDLPARYGDLEALKDLQACCRVSYEGVQLVLVPHRDAGLVLYRSIAAHVVAKEGYGTPVLLDASSPEALRTLPARLPAELPEEALSLWVLGAVRPGGDAAAQEAAWVDVFPALKPPRYALVLVGPPVLADLCRASPALAADNWATVRFLG